tara:strand:+ start:22 stop:306 length:285 start_codon:yes stop_codon:yes gene_type:complete
MTAKPKAPPEPRVHIRVDQWMTEAQLAQLWHEGQQRINDARHAMQPESEAIAAGLQFCGACGNGCAECRVRTDNPPMIEGFEPIGIDSEGGGHD